MAEINLKKLTTSGGPSEIDVNFNTILQGQADATIPLNVDLSDGTNPVTPTSVALTGNDLDIVIPAPVVPSGVLFKTIEPSQYTSYRTGDEGWRVQNGWFDYTPPAYPKAIAELNYTSANALFVLKNNLVVNGVSSKTRFVDINGIQAFSATGNANLVIIDKLTGLMYTRTTVSNAGTWNGGIDTALSYSIVVNGITYDDWFLYSKLEAQSMYNGQTDTQTGITLFTTTASYDTWVSSTNPATGESFYFQRDPRIPIPLSKLFGGVPIVAVRNARNLITAP